jgi:hypothetical protein
MTERRPSSSRWRQMRAPIAYDCPTSLWQHPSGVRVISSLVQAELPGTDGVAGPTWHISIARPAARPGEKDVRLGLLAFGMVGAEEDNHHPGNARHYFMPVDPAYRGICECKASEVNVTEPSGYQWTNSHDPRDCRGCAIAPVTGRPCPLHAGARP